MDRFRGKRSLSDNWLNALLDLQVALLLASVVVDSQSVWSAGPLLEVRTYNIFLADIVTISMALSVVAVRGWRRVRIDVALVIGVVAALVAVGFVATVLSTSLQPAVVRWRYWLEIVSVLAFAATFGGSRWRAWRRLILLAGVTGVVVLAGGLLFAGFSEVSVERAIRYGASSFYGSRPVGAEIALLLVSAVVFAEAGIQRPVMRTVAILSFGLAVIWTQVRTGWVALLVAMTILAVLGVRGMRSRATTIGVGLLAVSFTALVIVPVFTGRSILPGNGGDETLPQPWSTEWTSQPTGPGTSQPTGTGTSQPTGPGSSSTSQGSLEWRIQLWQMLLVGMESDPLDAVVGSITGVSPVIDDPAGQDSCCRTTAHNMLLDTLVTLGIFGVAAVGIIAFAYIPARRFVLTTDAVFLWSIVAFGFFYMWPAWAWLFVGTGLPLKSLLARGRGYRGADENLAPVSDSE